MNVIVTGASRGLGREVARELVGAGASVALVARDAARLELVRTELAKILHAGARVLCCAMDLAAESAIESLKESLAAAKMLPDVLINNAARQGPIGPFWQNDWLELEKTFRLNAFAALRLCQMVLPGMIARRKGKIINISGGGAASPRPGFTAYATSKTLLVRFTETLAEEVKPFGIDVNAVAPGAMKSAMTSEVLAAGPVNAGEKEYKAAQDLMQATTEVIARAARLCVFLSSSDSNGITGKLISAVWDPWTSFSERKKELENSDIYTLRRILPADRGVEWGQG